MAANAAAWDAFVQSQSYSSPYVRWGWIELLSDCFRLPRVCLVVSSGRDVRGVLPLLAQSNPIQGAFLTSLPFVNYGGAVAADASASASLTNECLHVVRQYHARHAELRQVPGSTVALPASMHKVRLILDLPPEPAPLWNGFNSKLRNQIRRPRKEGMEARVGGLELLGDFYRVLAIRWRQLGSPIYRRSFFERVLTSFPSEHAIITVQIGDVVIGVGWLHFHRQRCEIPWAATRVEWNRFSPNMLLYWRAIETAIDRGCTEFDFGRSTAGAPTHAFKMQWGPRCEPLPWYYALSSAATIPPPTDAGGVASAFRRAWSRVPLPWTIRLGHAFARRIPF